MKIGLSLQISWLGKETGPWGLTHVILQSVFFFFLFLYQLVKHGVKFEQPRYISYHVNCSLSALWLYSRVVLKMSARLVVLGRSLQFLGIHSGRRLGIHGNTKGLRTLSNAFNRSSSVGTCRYLGSTTIANAQSDVTKSQVKPKVLGPERRPLEVSGLNDHPGMLKVTWDNGRTGHYPYVWMRDNCPCPECLHQSSVARTILMRNLDINIQAEHIQVNNKQTKQTKASK